MQRNRAVIQRYIVVDMAGDCKSSGEDLNRCKKTGGGATNFR